MHLAVPVDPALPALPGLLPADHVPAAVAQLAAEAHGAGVDTEAAGISYVRYRPTRGCDVLWSFPRTSGLPLWVGAKMSVDAGRLVALPAFRQSAQAVREAFGGTVPAYRLLPDEQLLLQVFPLDARLAGLALASDPRLLQERFQHGLGVADDEVRITDVLPLHYKPWRRCVLRYTVNVRGRPLRYFGKVFRDHRGAPMVERMRTVRAQLLAARVGWDVAVPVTYIPDACMLVLAELEESEELSPLLRKAVRDGQARDTLRAQLERVAEGLFIFQQIIVEGLPWVGPRAVLSQYESEFDGIRQVAPALAASIEVQLRLLEAAALRLPPEEMVLCHGAFRYNQFLRRGDTLIALDFDALQKSGIAADAGEFLAYFDLVALRRPHLQPIIEECGEIFVAAVLRHSRLDRRWLAWHRAASLVKWTHRTFLSLDARWPELTDGLLRLAQEALSCSADLSRS